MLAFFFVLDAGGWQYGELLDRTDPLYLQATSACLATIVVMQMINLYLCRHPRRSRSATASAAIATCSSASWPSWR
jgi:sodium/potassium-transporting ATPase subunit alpha